MGNRRGTLGNKLNAQTDKRQEKMKALKIIWNIYTMICTVLITWLIIGWIVNGGYIGANGKKIHYEGLLNRDKSETLIINK